MNILRKIKCHSWPGPVIPALVAATCLIASAGFVTQGLAAEVPRLQEGSTELETLSLTVGQYTLHPEVVPGFELEALATSLRGPRIIHFNDERMLIGSKSGGVYWLEPPYNKVNLLVNLDGYPHSVVVRHNKIYVARTNAILVADYTGQDRIHASEFTRLLKLPGGGGHSSRTLKVGPDDRMYVGLGISGNCSDQWLDQSRDFKDRRGGLYVIDESTSPPTLKSYSSGLRNPIGFDWSPEDNQLYASNNGPDHHGFYQPPEQFVALAENSFHGMPWYQFDGTGFVRDNCVESTPPYPVESLQPPAALFPARNAPMDVAFIDAGADHPFAGDAIVALHGSWATDGAASGLGDPASRRPPGLVRVEFSGGKPVAVHDLVRGMQLGDGTRWSRPMGVAIGPDNEIYFSSDGGIHGLYRLNLIRPSAD